MKVPQQILDRAASFSGNGRHLEAALGAYLIGQVYGWRALCMLHSQHTLRQYEEVLGIVFNEDCPEDTSLSARVLGIRIARRLNSFWRVVKSPEFKRQRGILDPSAEEQGRLL